MAYVTLMQDWTTIQNSGSNPIVQSDDDWLDMADFLDIVFYVSTQQVSGTTPVLVFETSPSKDNDLFATMVSVSLTASATVTPQIIRFSAATVPLARYVRWRITGTTVIATFRVYVAATTQGSLVRR